MKVFVKTLKGTHFEIEVSADDTVADVKKNIEATQGPSTYPAEQQMLIQQGKVLKDDTTLDANKVAENSFIVVMLTKPKATSSGTSAGSAIRQTPAPTSSPASTSLSSPIETPAAIAAPDSAALSAPCPAAAPAATVSVNTNSAETNVYGQAASNLVAASNLEETIQNILDMGDGTWDRDIVLRALRAAYNNPERAVEYLYSGIPSQAEAPPVARVPPSGQTTIPQVNAPRPAAAQPTIPSSGPNVNPLDLFPQGLPAMGTNNPSLGNLDFLRNSPQFRALQAMVQANPQILQPMLQELGRQNPQIMRLIQEHHGEFLRLINEPAAEGGDGNILGQLAAAMPQTLAVTPEEREAIARLEAMGFERGLVLEVFFACNKNEELAANYLLDHVHEFED